MLSNDEIRAAIAEIVRRNPSTPLSKVDTMKAVKKELRNLLETIGKDCKIDDKGWIFTIGIKYDKELGNGYFMFEADCSPSFDAIWDYKIRRAKYDLNEWIDRRCQQALEDLNPFRPRSFAVASLEGKVTGPKIYFSDLDNKIKIPTTKPEDREKVNIY